MSTRLTAYDHHGLKWTPDHTVRVTPRYGSSVMCHDGRNKPTGYEVQDMLDTDRASRWVPTLHQAQQAAGFIMARRPRLDWGFWRRSAGRPSVRHGLTSMQCGADSPAGRVEVQVMVQQDPEHPGMWYVSFTVGRHHFGWLSDIRYIPHRMDHARAVAAHRAFRLACA